MKEIDNNSYKDMSLFCDVEDEDLKARNRGTVLANLAEDGFNADTQKMSPRAAADMIKYFSLIPKDERKPVLKNLITTLASRNLQVTFDA